MRRLLAVAALLISTIAYAGGFTWGSQPVLLGDAGAGTTSDVYYVVGKSTGLLVSCPAYAGPPSNMSGTMQLLVSTGDGLWQPLTSSSVTGVNVSAGVCTFAALDGGLDAGCLWSVWNNTAPQMKIQLVTINADGGYIGGPNGCSVNLQVY